MAPPPPPLACSLPPSSNFSPSTTSSSASSVQSPLSQSPHPAPLRGRSSVPFSWETQPGVPKRAARDDNPLKSRATSTTTPLRPPPSSTLRTNSDLLPTLRRKGSTRSPRTAAGASNPRHDPVFVRDPFAVALAECCSESQNHLDAAADDDVYYDAPAAAAAGGASRRWAAPEYYCSPLVTNKMSAAGNSSSRRWACTAAEYYYCSPPRVRGKGAANSTTTGGRGVGNTGTKHQLLGSLFGLRSLQGLYVSCKTASAVADSIAYVPSRPRTAAGRFRSTGTTSVAPSSSFSRSDSIGLNRRRRDR